ncbi:hypothetical protein EB796_002689 [Bugula neritina]|uniref:Uncharacterized protein n=1 Tax=Bugula neritina TaxID=10212 RepID=A0A7J7KJW5_BUGNE|nr:hypothetical protein EB796_002689 [Bugula neritina]
MTVTNMQYSHYLITGWLTTHEICEKGRSLTDLLLVHTATSLVTSNTSPAIHLVVEANISLCLPAHYTHLFVQVIDLELQKVEQRNGYI